MGAKRAGFRELGYFNWWVMSDEWQKLSKEWWVMVFLKTKQPLTFVEEGGPLKAGLSHTCMPVALPCI